MNLPYPLILASASPRRKEILSRAGINFQVVVRENEEIFPEGSVPREQVLKVTMQKLNNYNDLIQNNIVLCADTIVVQKGNILGKPKNKAEAISMLNTLSGTTHDVITAVILAGPEGKLSFTDLTKVVYKELDNDEISYYLDNYKPFDKAGGYGIQEWIGLIGIKEIHGSYFNVVGLPIHRVYQELKTFIH